MNLLEWAELIRNGLEILAALAGAGWAIWKWKSEILAHDFSITGDLTVESTPLAEDRALMTIRAIWSNRSQSPVRISQDRCLISIYDVSSRTEAGLLRRHELGEPVMTAHPFAQRDIVTIGPSAESVFSNQFLLKSGPTYLIVWDLYRSKDRSAHRHASWSRDIIWNSSPAG